MKLTKDRFTTWEDKDAKDYDKDLDDELMISVKGKESGRDIADYILMCQEKAGECNKMETMVFDLIKRLKICEENAKNWKRIR